MTRLTINIQLIGGTTHAVDYLNLNDCLNDAGLKTLFKDNMIETCSIAIGTKRITALPIMGWQRFRDQLISNSTTILRSMA